MNAQELRIGNWVNRKYFNPQPQNENWQLEPVEICALGFGKYNVKLKNGGHSVIDYVEPIPLTEEWLMRFGFEKYGKLHNSYKMSGLIIEEGFIKQYPYVLRKVINKDESIELCEFNHVHQLQNLYFALKNTELECTSK